MKIYIGYDSREDIAYQVSKYSVERLCDIPVEAINQQNLRDKNLYYRDVDALASTEFSLTRFLVPYLNNYTGWVLFIDCDTVFIQNPKELFGLVDDNYALMCVKHDYNPTNTIKMDGKKQYVYPRKNWSSVMLFNCAHPSNKKLSLDTVNTASPSFLHQMLWLQDAEIGSIPKEWNWLTDWYSEPEDGKPKLLHYTEGGPWFEEYKNCNYADVWLQLEQEYLRN